MVEGMGGKLAGPWDYRRQIACSGCRMALSRLS
jgi:hypothetical protein